YVVGAGGTILTNNGGTSWVPQSNGVPNQNLNGIACLSTTTCYVVGASGTILFNNSASWTESGPTSTSATPVTLNGVNHTTTYALALRVYDTSGIGAGWNLTITSTTFTTGTHSLSTTASSITAASCSPVTCASLSNS